MKRRKLKVIRELREILSDSAFNEFTMTSLQGGYESRFGLGECATSTELRRWLYRRILPLTKKGYLVKSDQADGKFSIYKVTDAFRKDYPFHKPTRPSKRPKDSAEKLPQVSNLKSKLSQYQVDMLACAGECKEYQQLATDYPHLKKQIEPMYRSARERSSELMGQVRAINNLLKQSGLPE
ncbi:MAG: hypothetical protein OQK12_11935 [Motiliproteus sp.]|nr:hypothetical protein [Motiliproteus sp.]MCW9052635.1 hypothetical protein [Motiliproteus sp.]